MMTPLIPVHNSKENILKVKDALGVKLRDDIPVSDTCRCGAFTRAIDASFKSVIPL